MRKRLLTAIFASAFAVAACAGGGGESGAPTTGGGGGGTTPPAGTTGTGGSTAPEFDPSSISGDVTLGAWESSPAEGEALKAALAGFAAKYPNIKVTQQTVAGVTTHGHADVQPYDNSTTAHTDETVVNTDPDGNPVSFNTAGAIRIWIKPALVGPCP